MIIEETELFDKEVLIGGDLGYANKARTKAITINDYGEGYRIRQFTSNGDMNWQRVDSQPLEALVKPSTCGRCKDCEHFDRLKEYNNVGTCWNDEVSKLLDGRDILWNEDFGCIFYKSKLSV